MRRKYLQSLHSNFPNKLFCTEILQLMQQIKPSFRTPFTMVISPFFFFFGLFTGSSSNGKRSTASRHVVGKLTYRTVWAFWVTDWSLLGHTGHWTGLNPDSSNCYSYWNKLVPHTGSVMVSYRVSKVLVSPDCWFIGNYVEMWCGSESRQFYQYSFIMVFLKTVAA